MIIPLKPSINRLPIEFREEFLARRAGQMRGRVGIYCLVSTLFYCMLSMQYLLRNLFKPSEAWILVWILCGTAVSYAINRFSKKESGSKLAAYLYTVVFLSAVVAYATTYWEHAFLFCFYFGSALILVALMIPWGMREIIFLSAIYIATYAGFILWLQYGLHLPVRSFPRFHAVLDGVTYMMVAGTTSLIIRYNDLRRDMDNFMLLKRIESQTVQFEKELELARRVNQTLVPIPFANEKAEIAVTYLPMGYVGGDYAKFRFIDNDRLIIFISDVTGHGVPAALLVNRVHAEFERLIGDESGPGKLLNKLNQFITRDFEGTQMYLSAFCGILDFRQKTFTYSNYGHLPQYLWRDGEKMILGLDSHRSFLGISFDDSEHHETVAYFGKGDNLLLFTDGVVEARDQRGSQYGEARLRDFMKRNSGKPAEPFNEALTHELRGFSGNSFDDDIFIMNVKVL